MVSERFGNAPSATRKDEVAEAVRLEYRRRGYPSAQVTARVDVFHQPDRATLVLDVVPGPRARILEVKATQVDAAERSTISELPNIKAGQIYDEIEIGRELQAWEDRMRSRGYYEARAIQNSSISDDGSVFVVPEPRAGAAGEARLRRRSASPRMSATRWFPCAPRPPPMRISSRTRRRAIESYFRARGYRDAAAPYTRQERAGELIITFKVTRGPRYLVGGVSVSGNFMLPTPELAELIRLKEGEPFVRSALRSGSVRSRTCITRPASRASRSSAADKRRGSEDTPTPDRRVNVTVAIIEGPRTEVRSVTFQGNMAMTDAEIRKLITTAPGRVVFGARGRRRSGHDRAGLSQSRIRERGCDAAVVRSRRATPGPTCASRSSKGRRPSSIT